jgi:hypothetical protein
MQQKSLKLLNIYKIFIQGGKTMRNKVILFVTVFMVLVLVIGAKASERPVTVSPGSEIGITLIDQLCPTFSWASVPWAKIYRVDVFVLEQPYEEVLYYEDFMSLSDPFITKEILGSALSWTPSLGEALRNGGEYVWFVRAVDVSGTGIWSTGKKFRVEAAAGLSGIPENLKEKLKESGLREGIFKNVNSKKQQGDITGGEDLADGNYSQNISVVQGYEGTENTFYGQGAGASHISSFENTFIGNDAGKKITSGYRNTFIGYMAGWGNITGKENTNIGYEAGCQNESNNNIFIGTSSGYLNLTGNNNTIIGDYAGFESNYGSGNVFLGHKTGYYETDSNKLYIDNSDTSSPLIYGEFDNNLVKINGNFRITGYLSLDNGSTQIDSTELNLLNEKTGVTEGSANNNKLVTQGYVDDHSGGGLTGDYMTDHYICKWDDGNTRLVDSLISENGGNVTINGSLSLNNFNLSLDNGSHWINSPELNILDGKSLASGSTNNNILVTKGYVDDNDDVGSILFGSENDGNENVYYGVETGSGLNTEGYYNSFFGYSSGHGTTTGDYNSFFGHESGYSNTTGSFNTAIGQYAGYNNVSGNYNVFLGYRAGSNETGSNKLYIDSSDTLSPLIYGEFDNNLVEINGSLGINGNLWVNYNNFSLDNGVTCIDSTELNILEGKTLATGSTNNNVLVTQGYVDENDDVGGGLTGVFMTDHYICKWDDTGTRLVDSIISESPGVINIDGKLGIGTTTPLCALELETTGQNAVIMFDRTDGATGKLTARVNEMYIGTSSYHDVMIVANNKRIATFEPDGHVGIGLENPSHLLHISGGAYCDGGAWVTGSSREYKENIVTLTASEAMAALKDLNPVKYNYKINKEEEYIGFIAEDVPDIVATMDRKGINTMDVVAILTKVVKKQQESIQQQQKQVREHQKTISALTQEITELKRVLIQKK